jgi:hypothetical protein
VTAIGDARTLSADLLTTTSGVEFQSLAEQFGFVVTRDDEPELLLPSAPDSQLRLRFAQDGLTAPDNQEETS